METKVFENPTYWAKLSGTIRSMIERMTDEEERELFRPIAEMTAKDMIRLAIGYHDTEWVK